MEEIQLNNLGGGSGASGAAIEQINVATFVADDKDGDGKKERDSWGSKVCCITENTLTLPSPFHIHLSFIFFAVLPLCEFAAFGSLPAALRAKICVDGSGGGVSPFA